MPTYTFQNTKTGITWTDMMKISEMEKLLEDNKHYQQVIVAMNIGDPVGLGFTKPPAQFQKEVLGRIKASVPHNNMNNTKFKI